MGDDPIPRAARPRRSRPRRQRATARTDAALRVPATIRRSRNDPHACGCRRCAAPQGGAIRGSGRPFDAHDPAAAGRREGVRRAPVYSCPRSPNSHLESPSCASAAVSVRAAAAMVRRRHAESGALADQPVDRRAAASDAAARAGRARRGRTRPRELSHDDRHARAARGDRRMARPPPRARRPRSRHAGAAGARQPRGAVRVRADGDRREPRRAPWC